MPLFPPHLARPTPYRLARLGDRLKRHAALSAATVLATVAICWLFLLSAPRPDLAGASLFLVTLPFFHAMAVVLAALALIPAALLPGGPVLLKSGASIWLLYLLLDWVAYHLFGLHIDRAVIEVMLLDFRGVGATPILTGASLLLGMVGLAGLFVLLSRLDDCLRGRPVAVLSILAATLVLFMGHAVASIWAFGHDRIEATRYSTYLPAYSPITSARNAPRLAAALPWLFPPERGPGLSLAGGDGSAAYPARFPRCDAAKARRRSVLMLVVDSWRASSLTPEIMPFTHRFAQGATRFEKHLSNGSATVPGLFSLLYGVNPGYFPSFRAASAENGSVLTRTLADQGHAMSVFSSNEFDRFSLRTLIFPMVPDERMLIRHTDAEVVADFTADIAGADDGAPRFDLVMLTSSHFPYSYPDGFHRFTPVPAVDGQHLLTPQMDPAPVLNDYHNSLHYVDALIGQVITALQRAGRLKQTIVVITGDHAEEFNDNGVGDWGHGSNFSRWQTHTPLILRVPGQAGGSRVAQVSAHVDVAPTLLRLLGCGPERAGFSTGEDLFALPDRRVLGLASYSFGAFWLDGVVFERSTGASHLWHDVTQEPPHFDRNLLRSALEQETRFQAK